MTTLIEMLAMQRAQSEGRLKVTADDIMWAQANIDCFEALRDCMGLDVADNDVLFDHQIHSSERLPE
ncbi:hypothetical protein [Pseudoalteromonas sp. MMG024]|uniref:hypothetical protein n=1 Tax=Pseudoalteromonas sp. MMG024 TaxID=2909980 RepID=UPI001F46D49E|nr:hypothetical protein [Pseudoalteromonas sp. MMG024]MCF6458348.1 hypothetical protein [Pseudoalteromonas sp. MMG024]